MSYYWIPADSVGNVTFNAYGFGTWPLVLALVLCLPAKKEHQPCLHWKAALFSLGNLRCCAFSGIYRTKFFCTTHVTTKPTAAACPQPPWGLPSLFSVCVRPCGFGDHSPVFLDTLYSTHGSKAFLLSEILWLHLHFYCYCLESLGWRYPLGTTRKDHTNIHK
jgi:hypothetical protein